ncbi:aldose 1-epimerase [Spirochaetia bacterium]|nr:aldose 1-epimerase [Spirochaetia bacterium]GHU34194.1 aldose 1-epimerase [Spirochaetia bacterium]
MSETLDISKERILSSEGEVFCYTLRAGDLSLSLLSFGATLTSLYVPSQKGRSGDILLGYSNPEDWYKNIPYLGVTVGRFANRIAGGRFSLNGSEFQLEQNDGKHSLHSGQTGFSNRFWKSDAYEENDSVFVRFDIDSPEGDGGFPGNCSASVVYGLSQANELLISYDARVDAPCPINMTNHAYYNLAGEGDILSHEMTLHASSYLEVDPDLIPTGNLIPVQSTPFDFRVWKEIRKDIAETGQGYDHCFKIDATNGDLSPCAEVFEKKSGRIMRVWTTQPGVQFYTGNFLNGISGKNGATYTKYSGLCLETQHFPDSPNQPNFPLCIYGPDKPYHEQTKIIFSVLDSI